MEEPLTFWHEKLDVYRRSLELVTRLDQLLADSMSLASVVEHIIRASESVVENIVTGNAAWSPSVKKHHFSVACGSALECAAGLDVCCVKKLVSAPRCLDEKKEVRCIVQMLVGLVQARDDIAQDGAVGPYASDGEPVVLFDHERLDVYQLGLEFVRWADGIIRLQGVPGRRSRRIDSFSTSIVLNVAEGNGRIEHLDRRQFIETARLSALKSVVVIDLMLARNEINRDSAGLGKSMLSRIVKMLMGMRGYLEEEASGSNGRP